MTNLFASRFSLIAFATASVRGVMTGADFTGTLKAALIAAAVFYGLGLIFGDLARRVVEDNVRTEIKQLLIKQSSAGEVNPDN